MRYGFLTFELPPDFGGGLSTYMLQSLRMLRRSGNDAFVIVIDNDVVSRKFDRCEGFDVLRVNVLTHPAMQTMGYWAAASFVAADAVKDAIQLFGVPDLLETCDGFGLGYFTLQRKLTLEAPFRDLRVAVTAHTPCSLIDRWDGASWHKLPRYWIREAEIFCLKAADIVFVPSFFLAEELRRDFECRDVAFSIVRNPFELLAGTTEVGTREHKMEEAPYYVFGSRLALWKGALDVVRAFDLYWAEGGAARLKLFGEDAPYRGGPETVGTFIRKRYAPHILAGRLLILGLVPPAVLAAEKRGAVALLHPSHKENFPYTVIEHMAAGGVVIATTSGGQAELIDHGKNGYLYSAANAPELVRYLAVCDGLSETDSVAIGRRARARVAELCSYETVAAAKREALLAAATRTTLDFPFIRGEEMRFSVPAAPAASPRLTVVVPYFNLPQFVTESVRSALASTMTDLEVLVVDDGSTDAESPRVLSEMSQWSRVRVLRKLNGGVADARNCGVAAARGDIVALLDADDLVMPSYYEKSLSILDRYDNVGFVGCWNEDFDDHGTIRIWPTFNPELPMQLIFNTTNCQGLVVRRAAYLAAGGHDGGLNMFLDDWEATIAMLALGIRGVMLPQPLYRYRIRPGSTFRAGSAQWTVNYEYIVAKHAAIYSKHAPEIIAFLNANGPNSGYHNPTWEVMLGFGNQTDSFAAGRLSKLVRGYYILTRDFATGRRIRRSLQFLSPLVDVALALAFRVYRHHRARI